MTRLSSVKLYKRYHLIFFGINLQDNPLKYFNTTLSNISKDSSMHASSGDGGDLQRNVPMPLSALYISSHHTKISLSVSLVPSSGSTQDAGALSLSLSLSLSHLLSYRIKLSRTNRKQGMIFTTWYPAYQPSLTSSSSFLYYVRILPPTSYLLQLHGTMCLSTYQITNRH